MLKVGTFVDWMNILRTFMLPFWTVVNGVVLSWN